MKQSKNTEQTALDVYGQTEAQWGKGVNDRAATEYEHDVVCRAISPLGRPDLYDDDFWPLTAQSMNEHPKLKKVYPLKLKPQYWGISNPPPWAGTTPQPTLSEMAIVIAKSAFFLKPHVRRRGYGVVFPYGYEESLILHNRPDLAQGLPLVRLTLKNGCPVAIHYFEPFIDDVADHCRVHLAKQGSELMKMINSNYNFRDAYWGDYEDRDQFEFFK